MIEHIMGVFKLESATFEDIEHDPAATSQAAIVVLIVAFVLAVGTGFAGLVNGHFFLRKTDQSSYRRKPFSVRKINNDTVRLIVARRTAQIRVRTLVAVT